MCYLKNSIKFIKNGLLINNNMNTLHSTTSLYGVASPLEQFEVTKLIGLDAPVIGLNFALTNLGFLCSSSIASIYWTTSTIFGF